MEPMQGNSAKSRIELGYTEIFHILAVTSVFFYTCEGILGTLCSSFMQIKAPSLFVWEEGIALHAMQGNRASSLSERQVSWFFSSFSGNMGYVLELRRGRPLKTFVCSVTSGLLSCYDGHLRNLN